MKKRKICVVTGTRAEFGILYWTIKTIQDDPDLDLQLLVTGMHLSPEFGLTVTEIEESGLPIRKRLEILLSSDSGVGVAKSMGLGMIGFGDALAELEPDLIVLLGDRFEIFAAAAAATVSRVPIAHFHGGELTEGLIDDPIRHSVTKMSHLHFVSTDLYRHRVIQLGEDPERVFNFGAPGLEHLNQRDFMDKSELEASLGAELGQKSLLVTFHPVTLEPGRSEQYFGELLKALDQCEDTFLLFTKPNADMEGRKLIAMVDEFCQTRSQAVAVQSLGSLRYFSALKYVTAVVGNSSSGLIEAPSFGIGTVDIGDRQRGRFAGPSVVQCEPVCSDIKAALDKVMSAEFREGLKNFANPYGDGHVAARVVEVLRTANLDDILKKRFHDIESGRVRL